MTSIRRFRCTDLFRICPVNLDPLTETYQLSYYITYAIRWPECFTVAEQPFAYSLNAGIHHQQPLSPAALTSHTAAAACPSSASFLPSSSASLLSGYNMGKVEGQQPSSWHGHVSALSISAAYRRLGLAASLMLQLERVCDQLHAALFVDLYVRQSNALAIAMYRRLGYVVYRQVIGYYMGEEDALDMRKALSADKDRRSEIPLPHPVHPGGD